MGRVDRNPVTIFLLYVLWDDGYIPLISPVSVEVEILCYWGFRCYSSTELCCPHTYETFVSDRVDTPLMGRETPEVWTGGIQEEVPQLDGDVYE